MATTHAVRLSELQNLPEEEKGRVLSSLVQEARTPEDNRIAEFDARIAEFERRYELPSIEMVDEVQRGIRKETDDIASWLLLLKIRKRVRDYRPS